MKPLINNMDINNIGIIFLILILLFGPGLLFAQYENYTWVLGNSKMNFNSNTQGWTISRIPIILDNEKGAILNDPLTGTTLFYTDGKDTVYNRLNQLMDNGDDMLGNFSNAQGSAIAKVPGVYNQYYLFINGSDERSGLHVSKIDMNANNGLGQIVPGYKKIPLGDSIREGMQVIPKPNCDESWLIVPLLKETGYSHKIYKITKEGVFPASKFKSLDLDSHYNLAYHSGIRKLAGCAHSEGIVYTLDFDPLLGILSNPQIVTNQAPGAYDVEWSPDGRKLYYSSLIQSALFQYDYDSLRITKIFTGIEDDSGTGITLGPDGSMYFLQDRRRGILGRIRSPNASGLACNFQRNAFFLPSRLSWNFPEILPSYTAVASNSPFVSGVINDYTAVQDICGNQFRVQSSKDFAEGDTVMVIQMQGAEVITSNTPDYGKVINYGSAGKYEFNIIAKINGNEVLFKQKMLNRYDIRGRVQMVSFPNLGDADICNLTCKVWDGRTGGVLAFKGGRLKLYGSIDVSGKGFRGGQQGPGDNEGCDVLDTAYFYPESTKGFAYKGEGIAVQGSGEAKGKGSHSTGGGGGVSHNFGGGGGANIGEGGFGGTWFLCPNIFSRRGIGGRGIDYLSIEPRLFLGGGGGAGHANDQLRISRGGNGGGIIFIQAKSLINSKEGSIMANGESLFSIISNNDDRGIGDGGGGGGGGGSVALWLEENLSESIDIQIRGGQGLNVHFQHGHGGGGGGGLLLVKSNLNSASLRIDARGGKSGTGLDGKTNLATDGKPGGSRSISEFPMGKEMWQPLLLDTVLIEPTCKGTVLATVITQSSADTLQFSIDGGKTWQEAADFELSKTGRYRFQIFDGCITIDTPIQVIVPSPLASIKTVTPQICATPGSINLQGLGGIPPYSYRIVDQTWQDSGSFKALKSQIYTLQVMDQTKCLVEEVIEVEDRSYRLTLSPSPGVLVEKGDSVKIEVDLSGSFKPPLMYSWYPAPTLSCNDCKTLVVKPEASTKYEVIVTDANGCRDTAQVQVNVRDVALYFPNAIYPISANSPNQTFFPQGNASKIKWIDLKVFKKWGGMVYSYQGKELVNDASLGWDGSFRGKPLPIGEYVYACVVQFFDGTMYTYKGEVMLLR